MALNNYCWKIILMIAVAFLIIYILQNYYSPSNKNYRENYSEYDNQLHQQYETNNSPSSCLPQVADKCGNSSIYTEEQDIAQASCFPKSQLTPDDLLPTNECNVWSKSNPSGSGSLADRNFLQAGWATGISSVGSTLRNANLQLRSEPPNPQVSVSPWMQSSISPDLERKPLELGGFM
jgi:hypothetical protein